jgi:hypothetical protein
LQWLDECIQHHQMMQQQLQQQQQSSDSTAAAAALPDPQLFAAVMGAASEQERVRSAKAAAERDVAGVCAFEAVQKATTLADEIAQTCLMNAA